MTEPTRDVGITFAGGGNRAFYQLGLVDRWRERLLPRVAAIGACSAGAFVATLLLTDRVEATREFFLRRRDGVTRNFAWEKLLAGERPTPHGPIYRDTLMFAYEDGGLGRIRAQPFPVLVVASSFPRGIPAPLATGLGLAAYSLEKAIRKSMVHPRFGRALGFSPIVVDARECETPDELAALVLASSATPPFTPIGAFRGRALLDGGMVDNVPAFATEAVVGVRKNLVLLTRPYPPAVLGTRGTRAYVAPTREVPIERWDYTRPHLLDETIAMGAREAEVHAEHLSWALGSPA